MCFSCKALATGSPAFCEALSHVCRVRHKHFLRAASDQARGPGRQQATKLAMRFVQVSASVFAMHAISSMAYTQADCASQLLACPVLLL